MPGGRRGSGGGGWGGGGRGGRGGGCGKPGGLGPIILNGLGKLALDMTECYLEKKRSRSTAPKAEPDPQEDGALPKKDSVPEQVVYCMERYFEVDGELCSGCGLCIEKCPTGAIIIKEATAKIIKEKCNLCGQCFDLCPNSAIKAVSRKSK